MTYNKITVSGKICTGKTTLFNGLHKRLGWPTFSTSQFVREYTRTHQTDLEKAEEQNEKMTVMMDTRMKEMLKTPGNLLAEGWMAGIMANHYKGILKVLLVCDDKVRIQRFADREHVTYEEAKARLETRENNWMHKVGKVYKRNDFFDPKHYDVVIDTSDKTAKEVETIVLSSI